MEGAEDHAREPFCLFPDAVVGYGACDLPDAGDGVGLLETLCGVGEEVFGGVPGR